MCEGGGGRGGGYDGKGCWLFVIMRGSVGELLSIVR